MQTAEGRARRWAWLRRMLFWWIAGMMGDCMLLFVAVDQFGFDPNPTATIVVAVFVLPLILGTVMTLRARRRGTLVEPDDWPRSALAGAVMFTLWGAIYFVVSRIPDPSRILYLPTVIESYVTLRPPYAVLYVLLYPIFLLPFLVVRERDVLRRLVVAYLIMFVLCSACFIAIPVGVARPTLPPDTDLGTWVLGVVWATDVSWNCMPSEHCMAALVAAMTCWESDRRVGAFAFLGAFVIGMSTLFIKQHYLVDVIAGFALAIGLHAVLRLKLAKARHQTPLPGFLERILG